jgi:hypothetical protein
MEDLLLFKENLRDELKSYSPYSFGYTSTIYKKGNYVIKEIYLESTLEKSIKLNELLANCYFATHPRYGRYSVPFISYDTFDKTLLLKFKYMGKNLEESILHFSAKELLKIHKNITHALHIVNKKITHRDLHIANIFIDEKSLEVSIGDWGRGLLEPDTEHEDYDFYLFSFLRTIKLSYFMKFYKKIPINYKVLQKKVNNEMEYTKKKFPHKPKSFYPKLKLYITDRITKIMIEQTSEYKQEKYLPEDIKELLKILV